MKRWRQLALGGLLWLASAGAAFAQASVSLWCFNPNGTQATNNLYVPCQLTTPLSTINIGPDSQASLSFANGQPISLFVDDFGTGTLNTSTKWNRPTTGGGGNATAATNAVGQTTLGSGTSANGYSLLQSQRTVLDRNPGYDYFQTNVNLPVPGTLNAEILFGFASVPSTPTAAAPCTNAAAFEYGIDGKLRAVTCASGTKLVVADLSVAQGTAITPGATAGTWIGNCNCTPQIQVPKSGSTTVTDSYKYVVLFRGDNILWYIEQPSGTLALVAYTTRGAVGLDVNQVPLTYLVVANSTGPAAAVTLQVNQVSLGDSGKNVEPGYDRVVAPTQALTSVNDAVGLNAMGAAACTFTVTANTNVTLVFEATDYNASTWNAVTAYPWGGGPGIQSVPSSGTGAWTVPCAGFNQVRMRVSAVGATPTATATAEAGIGHSVVIPANSDPCSSAAKSSVAINLTSATTTSLVAVSGTTSVYTCGFSLTITPSGTTADTIAFEYGTGAACSSPTLLTGTFGNGDLTTTVGVTPISYGNGGATLFKAPSGNGVCAVSAGTTVNVQGVLSYVQQ